MFWYNTGGEGQERLPIRDAYVSYLCHLWLTFDKTQLGANIEKCQVKPPHFFVLWDAAILINIFLNQKEKKNSFVIQSIFTTLIL